MRATITNLASVERRIRVPLWSGRLFETMIEPSGTVVIERIDPFDINTSRGLREDPTIDIVFAFDESDIPSILTLYGGDIEVEGNSVSIEAATRNLNFDNASVLNDGPNRVTVDLDASPGVPGISRHRQFVELAGVQDGVNQVFTLPEVAVHNMPNGLQVKVYLNGLLLRPGSTRDYEVSESGGVGTGYDTVTFLNGLAPKARDSLWADYVVPAP